MKPKHNVTIGLAVGCLLIAGTAMGNSRDRRGDSGAGDSGGNNNGSQQAPQGSDSTTADPIYFNALTGIHAGDVDLSGAPVSDEIVVVYQHNFGIYPYINSSEVHFNGSVPQNINMQEHLRELAIDIERYIPDPDFDGFVSIDYEEWPPFWEDCMERYREYSRELVREANPSWDDLKVERKAKREFEKAAKKYMKKTLKKCQQLRPKAKWGYWAYPKEAHHDNNANWLWNAQDAFFPDLYMPYRLRPDDATDMILGEIGESWYITNRLEGRVGYARELAGNKPVLAFTYPRYENRNPNQWIRLRPLTPSDLTMCMEGPLNHGADGIVLWDNVPQPSVADAFQIYYDDIIAPEFNRVLQSRGLPFGPADGVIDPGENDEGDSEPIAGVDDDVTDVNEGDDVRRGG